VALAAFDLLAAVIASDAAGSVVLTLWLSITPAVGLASRPARSRSSITRWWLSVSQVPSSRNRANQRYAVDEGGKSLGSRLQAIPPRRT